MNRQEFIRKYAEKTHTKIYLAKEFITDLEDLVIELVKSGENFNLKNEILDFKVSTCCAEISFKNGSNIKVVTASDSARSTRANFILADEFV